MSERKWRRDVTQRNVDDNSNDNSVDSVDSPKAAGYPQLTPEYIVQQNPDVIFLADTKCCAQNAASVGARPGWDAIAAVRNGLVFELDDDVASRWGPRVVDLVNEVGYALLKLRTGA